MFSLQKRAVPALLVVTGFLLLHVHTQVSIFQVSYSIQKKERKLEALSDQYKILKYEVSRLHSLAYLDKRRSELKLDLVMPKDVKVIKVPVPRQVEPEVPPPSMLQKGFFSFVQLVKEAQAKTSR